MYNFRENESIWLKKKCVLGANKHFLMGEKRTVLGSYLLIIAILLSNEMTKVAALAIQKIILNGFKLL